MVAPRRKEEVEEGTANRQRINIGKELTGSDCCPLWLGFQISNIYLQTGSSHQSSSRQLSASHPHSTPSFLQKAIFKN